MMSGDDSTAHQATHHRPLRPPTQTGAQEEGAARDSAPHRQDTHKRAGKAAAAEAEDAPAALPEHPRIVTAQRKHSTHFGPVQDIDAEEHQRRGDDAEALFREIVNRRRGDG